MNRWIALMALMMTTAARAENAACLAKNPQDAYARQVCAGKSETLCRWDASCRWAYAALGACEARNPDDAYSRSVCAGKTETLCKWDAHCAWNE